MCSPLCRTSRSRSTLRAFLSCPTSRSSSMCIRVPPFGPLEGGPTLMSNSPLFLIDDKSWRWAQRGLRQSMGERFMVLGFSGGPRSARSRMLQEAQAAFGKMQNAWGYRLHAMADTMRTVAKQIQEEAPGGMGVVHFQSDFRLGQPYCCKSPSDTYALLQGIEVNENALVGTATDCYLNNERDPTDETKSRLKLGC